MNRIALITLFSLSTLLALQAQNPQNFCGTPPGKSAWLQKYQQHPEQFLSNRSQADFYIPLTIHIVGTSEGEGYYSLNNLYQSLCTLNDDFAASNIQFYIKGDINYINNDNYYDHDFSQGGQMMSLYNVGQTVNCYFVDSPAGNCGYYSPSRDAVAMSKGCSGPESHTWAHELGHFFSLPHTFSGWEGRDYEEFDETPLFLDNGREVEFLDGSNCDSAGDGFCDTPADYLSFRWGCNGEGLSNIVQNDPIDSTFRSDGTFIMSYASDGCSERFSEEQMTAMRANIVSERPALLSNPPAPVLITDMAEAVFPLNEAFIGEASSVTLEWTEVPGAEWYSVTIGIQIPDSDNTVQTQNFLTTGNSVFVEGLFPLRTYRWTVRTYNRYDGCAPASAPLVFTLDEEDLTSSTEAEQALGLEVFPQPVGNGQTVNVVWHLAEAEATQITLYNATGQLIQQQSFAQSSGRQQIQWPTTGLAPGLYLLDLRTASGERTFRKLIVE
jgi:hypothetical protein